MKIYPYAAHSKLLEVIEVSKHEENEVGRLGLRTQRGSLRTSQEGPWLPAGEKSHARQEEVRAEFID